MCTSRSSMSDSVNWVTMSSCSHYVCGHIESKDNSVKPPSWTRRSYEGIKALGSTVYNKQYHERESKGIRGVDWRFSCVWWNFQRLYEDKVFVVLEWDSVCKLIVPSHNNDTVLTKWIAKIWEWDSIKAAINNIFVLTIDKITFWFYGLQLYGFGFTLITLINFVNGSSRPLFVFVQSSRTLPVQTKEHLAAKRPKMSPREWGGAKTELTWANHRVGRSYLGEKNTKKSPLEIHYNFQI